MAKIEITLVKEDKKKHSVRFKSNTPKYIQTIYVMNDAYLQLGSPEEVKLTLESNS